MKNSLLLLLMITFLPQLSSAWVRSAKGYTQSCNPRNINTEFKWLVCNCQNEAGGESDLGQQMVTKVVMRRAQLGRFGGNSLVGVITKDYAFSWIKQGPWNAPSARCIANTQKALSGCVDSRTPDHYHADYVRPKWGRTLRREGKVVKQVGAHIFYADYKGVGGRSCSPSVNMAGLGNTRNRVQVSSYTPPRTTPRSTPRSTQRYHSFDQIWGNIEL